MSNYKCIHCNQTANSKCVQNRSIFLTEGPDDQEDLQATMIVTWLGNTLRYGQNKGFNNTYVPTLNIDLHNASYPLNRELNDVERQDRKEQARKEGKFYEHTLKDKEPVPKYDLYERIAVSPPDYRQQRRKERSAALEIIKQLSKIPEKTLQRALCDHEWEYVGTTECMFGCCKPKQTTTKA